jgi:hypothetical protein
MAHLVYWPSSLIKWGIGPNPTRSAAFFFAGHAPMGVSRENDNLHGPYRALAAGPSHHFHSPTPLPSRRRPPPELGRRRRDGRVHRHTNCRCTYRGLPLKEAICAAVVGLAPLPHAFTYLLVRSCKLPHPHYLSTWLLHSPIH